MPIPPAKIIPIWACDSHACFRQSTLWRERQWYPVTQPSVHPLSQPSFSLICPVYHRGWLTFFHIWVSHEVVVLSLPQCSTTAPTKNLYFSKNVRFVRIQDESKGRTRILPYKKTGLDGDLGILLVGERLPDFYFFLFPRGWVSASVSATWWL